VGNDICGSQHFVVAREVGIAGERNVVTQARGAWQVVSTPILRHSARNDEPADPSRFKLLLEEWFQRKSPTLAFELRVRPWWVGGRDESSTLGLASMDALGSIMLDVGSLEFPRAGFPQERFDFGQNLLPHFADISSTSPTCTS